VNDVSMKYIFKVKILANWRLKCIFFAVFEAALITGGIGNNVLGGCLLTKAKFT